MLVVFGLSIGRHSSSALGHDVTTTSHPTIMTASKLQINFKSHAFTISIINAGIVIVLRSKLIFILNSLID